MIRPVQFVALVLMGLGLAMLMLYQRQFSASASGGEPIKVLTYVKAVERDKVITEDMLVVREVPGAYVEDRAVKDIERAKAVGLHLTHAVRAGETMLWTDLVTTGERHVELSSLVPAGNRAVCVRTSEDSSTALILPGDYVDIIGVMSETNVGPESSGRGYRTATSYAPPGEDRLGAVVLVQHVLVLASGLATDRDDVTIDPKVNNRSGLLTLSLTVPEAQLVALAADKGRISVALRNPDDARTAVISDLSSNSLLSAKERDEIKGRRPGAAGPTRTETAAPK